MYKISHIVHAHSVQIAYWISQHTSISSKAISCIFIKKILITHYITALVPRIMSSNTIEYIDRRYTAPMTCYLLNNLMLFCCNSH